MSRFKGLVGSAEHAPDPNGVVVCDDRRLNRWILKDRTTQILQLTYPKDCDTAKSEALDFMRAMEQCYINRYTKEQLKNLKQAFQKGCLPA